MRVKCIRNSIAELPNTNVRKWIKKRLLRYDDDHPLGFAKGQEYVVYGMHFWENHPFYFVCDEEDNEYPIPHYAGFFEVVDESLSSCWKLAYKVNEEGEPSASLLHKNWADDPMFYENLVDGEEEEVALFQEYKKEMDEEANSRGSQA